ncbi:AAA family ATPase [Noviherbaspirillum sp. 17J57-3]|uniref:non-specific serine/threonine protein kinase n=2 Tax=Noviherbaspirillum galbum TaxID=2709383 RepID=A0A6B3SYB6_9BURK|nr:AAA family ATPase [Noviherbaspirillum galbum]
MPELDVILRGGLLKGRIHLLEGKPGTGKTSIGMQFLVKGAEQRERCLYIALSETEQELRGTAESHDWSLDGIDICEIVPVEANLADQQSVLFPAEVELSKTIKLITDCIEKYNPTRVVIDSVSEIRLLAEDAMRYRRQIIALKQFLLKRDSTVLLLDDLTAEPRGYELESTVHGVILLEQRERSFGSVRRSMRIIKMRGADYQSGWHDFAITKNEVLMFPSLIADEHHKEFAHEPISSDIPEMDDLLGGGMVRGNSALILGPSGAGKSSLALQYANAAAKRGERAAYFSFDESSETLLERATGLSMSISDAIKRDSVHWERINPTRISPGEFIWKVRRQVEDRDVSIVVIDSLNSYMETMHEEQALMLQMHELLSYLSNMGVLCLIIVGQTGLLENVHDPLDVTYITDTVILLRFYEADGAVHKAISVVKKRPGRHESTIREFTLTDSGVQVGPQLHEFEGVLTGVPRFIGKGGHEGNVPK